MWLMIFPTDSGLVFSVDLFYTHAPGAEYPLIPVNSNIIIFRIMCLYFTWISKFNASSGWSSRFLLCGDLFLLHFQETFTERSLWTQQKRRISRNLPSSKHGLYVQGKYAALLPVNRCAECQVCRCLTVSFRVQVFQVFAHGECSGAQITWLIEKCVWNVGPI